MVHCCRSFVETQHLQRLGGTLSYHASKDNFQEKTSELKKKNIYIYILIIYNIIIKFQSIVNEWDTTDGHLCMHKKKLNYEHFRYLLHTV